MKKDEGCGGEVEELKMWTQSHHLSWRESGQSPLKLNIHILSFFGQWTLSRSWPYRAYTVLSLVSIAVSLTMSVVGTCLLEGLEEVTSALTAFLPMVTGLAKALLLLCYQPDFNRLVRRLDALILEQGGSWAQMKSVRAFEEAHRKTLVMTVLVNLYFVVVSVYWPMVPLLEDSETRRLPFVQLPWMKAADAFHYWFVFFLQTYTTEAAGLITVNVELYFLGVMSHISAQFEILSSRLTRLPRSSDYREASFDGREPVVKRSPDIHEELCSCIKTHQKLLRGQLWCRSTESSAFRFIETLDDLMSPFAMAQFAVGTLSVCVVLFQVMHSQLVSSKLKCAGWLPGLGLELFIYCWGGHQVAEQGEAVALAAYSAPWYEAGLDSQRAVHLMMCRAQKPPELTAGHLYTVNRAAFVSMQVQPDGAQRRQSGVGFRLPPPPPLPRENSRRPVASAASAAAASTRDRSADAARLQS
ncbi:odorant receptor 49b-like [Schistocerca gregaria]|uniref:odorant receptor 49b-like n=1 Tax=Schistocerca gregaria TaxID=7010 RepID=UPI00211E7E99|nr:odorant receptor 49b-like [Schistocerca gregaria]